MNWLTKKSESWRSTFKSVTCQIDSWVNDKILPTKEEKEATVIRHKNSKDVAFLVSEYWTQESAVSFQGYWLNVSGTGPLVLAEDTIRVNVSDISSWEIKKVS